MFHKGDCDIWVYEKSHYNGNNNVNLAKNYPFAYKVEKLKLGSPHESKNVCPPRGKSQNFESPCEISQKSI